MNPEIIKKTVKPRLTAEQKAKLKAKAEEKAKKDLEKEKIKLEKEQLELDKLNSEYINGNPWYYKDQIFTSDKLTNQMHGFIYMIEELSTGKIYIGQKILWTKKIKIVNKKRKKIDVESDWKNYYSSSAYINEKVQSEGTSDFKRSILIFCVSDGSMNYAEMKLQMDLRVLENSDKYINGYIGGRISHSHIKFDQIIEYDLDKLNMLYTNTYFGFKR